MSDAFTMTFAASSACGRSGAISFTGFGSPSVEVRVSHSVYVPALVPTFALAPCWRKLDVKWSRYALLIYNLCSAPAWPPAGAQFVQ